MPPAYELLLLNTSIPQIQAAQSGDTYVCPRDIQITANLDVTGNTILGDASTDTVQVNGYMGVGGAGASSTGLLVSSSALTTSGQAGISSSVTFNSSATVNGISVYAKGSTAAASFTLANGYGYYADNFTKGAGSTITNQHGLYIVDQTQGTNNYGITSLVSSGSNKWNIYASGTAANYFAGNVGIGTSSPSAVSGGAVLEVSNASGSEVFVTRADTTLTAGDFIGGFAFKNTDADGTPPHYAGFKAFAAAAENGAMDLHFYSARAGYESNAASMVLEASGNVGIGTSSPNASAILDAQSTTKGVRMPNMTTTQKNAIVSPAAGLIVFDTTLAKLCVYSGSAWETITSV